MEIQKDIIHFEFSTVRDAHRDLCSVRCLCLPQGGKPTRPPTAVWALNICKPASRADGPALRLALPMNLP